ncbi:cupredoxin domain-containing protein [Paenibacillus sp. MMO-177]|uniref:cupredoxin domain-containing protein n=1 Tax=Paenibacillus sp. MMO-177 TaxID=3081289 RepID=UPI0030193C7D
MFSILACAVVLFFTIYFIVQMYKRKDKLTCLTAMMIAMTVGMMSSLALGVILGVLLNHDLTLSSMIAVLFGIIAGYLTGKPVSLMAALDGMLAGVMGGMMGAMLGVMLVVSEPMLLFVSVIFIFIMSVLHQLVDQETGKSAAGKQKNSGAHSISLLTLAIGIVFVGALVLFQRVDGVANSRSSLPQQNNKTAQVQTSTEGTAGYQTGTIEVKPTGYGPQNIQLKSGVPTQINFVAEATIGCLGQLISDELGIQATLNEGNNFITLKDAKPGTYSYTCGMGMYGGTITIE